MKSIQSAAQRLGLVAIAAVVIAVAPRDLSGQAGRSEAEASRALAAQISRMRELALAMELARYGQSQSDPLPLMVAASIVLNGGWTPLAQIETDPPGADTDDTLVPLQLLDRADRLALGNPAIGELLKPLRARAEMTTRGAAGGVKLASRTLSALEKHRYEIVFLGGQPAAVYVSGDRASAMHCTIFDADGRLVASDLNDDAECLITWLPIRRSKFVVEVRNAQAAQRRYLFMTN